MQFFLENATADEIKRSLADWAIEGIVLNQRFVDAEIKKFLKLIDGTDIPLVVPVDPSNADAKIEAEARKLAKLSSNVVVSIPCTLAGFRAARNLTLDGVACNMTSCFSVVQALHAMRLNAQFVSLPIGVREMNGENTREFVEECVQIRDTYGFHSQFIATTLLTGRQIVDAALAGADAAACSLALLEATALSTNPVLPL